MTTYRDLFLSCDDGDDILKKLASDLFNYISKDIKQLQEFNSNIMFLINWKSIPKNLKWKTNGEELEAKENVIRYLKFSRIINYLCNNLPQHLYKHSYCKKVFLQFKRMILHIKHNPLSNQSNGYNCNEYFVHGTDLHVTINANLPLLMIEKYYNLQLDEDEDLAILIDPIFLYEIDIDKKIFNKQLINRISNIIKLDIGIDWRGTRFMHQEHIEYFDECKTNFILLRSDGSIDAAYFPKSLPININIEMTETLESRNINIKNFTKAIIGGSWNRYGNSVNKVVGISNDDNLLLDNLNNNCQDYIMQLLKYLNPSFSKKLDTINDDIKQYKTYAKYPTLALNVLGLENYNIAKKPYKLHNDRDNCGVDILVYFGKSWNGGELLINYKEDKTNFKIISFPIQPRDIVFLNSRQYHHQVTKVTDGVRYGLVYFAGIDHFPVRKKDYKKPNKQNYFNNMDDKLLALPFEKAHTDLREDRTEFGRSSICIYHKSLKHCLPLEPKNKKRKK